MGKKSKEVDAYIARSPEFAQPILKKLRELFHRAGPKIEEEMKWHVPFFVQNGNVGGMAGFKKYAAWGLMKAKLIKDPTGKLKSAIRSMGEAKLTSVEEIPSDSIMIEVIRQAIALNEGGVKLPPRKVKPPPKPPADFAAALKKSAKATAFYKLLPPSKQRDYVDWIEQAKQAETRERRIKQAVDWLAQGKPRNWKYEMKVARQKRSKR